LGGEGGDRGARHGDALRLPGLGGDAQGGGLAGPGRAGDQLDPPAAGEQVQDGALLVAAQPAADHGWSDLPGGQLRGGVVVAAGREREGVLFDGEHVEGGVGATVRAQHRDDVGALHDPGGQLE